MPLMPISPSMQMMQPGMNGNQMMQPGMNGNQMIQPGMSGNQMMQPGMSGNQMMQPGMSGNPTSGGSIVDSLFSPNLSGSSTGATIRETQKYEEPKSPGRQRQYDSDKNEIRKLARNINKSLDNYEPSKVNTDEEKTEEEKDDKENIIKKEDDYSILKIVKEMLLIIIIYVILSQGFVRRTIAGHVPQLNTNNGVVPFTGYVIYGGLLAILFVFFRYFIIK